MLYIHHITCVSPQQSFDKPDLEKLHESRDNKLFAIEPSYEGIPNNVLRRMGKAVKISVGAALPLLQLDPKPDGIILGTANGGMEDCIKFMNQIIQYDEDTLAPGNFVQSTPNGLAAQIALIQKNKGYNITHVHRGHSFENALLDAALQLKEHPGHSYLLGATDEISTYNYNVDRLAGWYKEETISNADLYTVDSPASIAGEGAVMMRVSKDSKNAIAHVVALKTWHSEEEETLTSNLSAFVKEHGHPDLFISGENGDNRLKKYYSLAENVLPLNTDILRFKHMSGEYPTASSQAVFFATYILQTQKIPSHALKRNSSSKKINTILIYNTYKGAQHSLILMTLAGDSN